MGKKAEHVNLGKTKILAFILNQDLLKRPEKDPCAVCLAVTGRSQSSLVAAFMSTHER